MSTIIYPSPIFGPIMSRRLGISLGINLLPEGGKWCSFDCVYCECGFNADHRTKNPLPSIDMVEKCLIDKLESMKVDGMIPDVLTFAGNGEPTLHPDFPKISQRVMEIRDMYCPSAKVSILSNGTQIHRTDIRDALMLFDNNIQKLDTVNPIYINKVDRPQGNYDINRQIENLQKFNGKVIIQTMFMSGEMNGESVDNTSEEYVIPYLEALQKINPKSVMIYTIDRETPAQDLEKASKEVLNNIGKLIEALGYSCSVSY